MLYLTIWMNTPTFYQADLYRVLATLKGVDVEVIFARKLSHDRLQLGWQNDLSGYRYRFLNRHGRIVDATRLAWLQRNRVHIVNGIWGEIPFTAALFIMALAGSSYMIYSEAPDPTLSRSPAKRLLRKALGQAVVRKASGFLPISHFATQFYTSLGGKKEIIYPFGYFRSQARAESSTWHRNKNRVEIIFIGQLIHRKGIDLLLRAVTPLVSKHPTLFLSIIGRGELMAELKEQAARLGIAERILFEGSLPSSQIPTRLAKADLLVLPSRWDGWGIVVNEALSVGVPVLVSDQCGASELVHHGTNGYIFRSENVEDLRLCLNSFLDNEDEWHLLRTQARRMGERISTNRVAYYLVACLQHMMGVLDVRPSPPWVRGTAGQSGVEQG